MKSNKQRRAEIMAKRHERAAAVDPTKARISTLRLSAEQIAADPRLVAMNNSYGVPRLWYTDSAFTCRDCGKPQVWTAKKQKWWYEVAQGSIYSRAVRCAPCREAERLRVKVARKASAAGLAGKLARVVDDTEGRAACRSPNS